MPYSNANNPAHWRKLARDARRVAENLIDEKARGHMIACAEAYERLALLAEKHPLYVKPSAAEISASPSPAARSS